MFRKYILKFALLSISFVLLIYGPKSYALEIFMPEVTPKDFDIEEYLPNNKENQIRFLEVADNKIWFITRSDNFLYAYQCTKLSVFTPTEENKNPCSYRSPALEISPSIYQPGGNIYGEGSFGDYGGGNLQLRLSGAKNQLAITYGYEGDYSLTLDKRAFKIFSIYYKRTKFPDYRVYGYFLSGDFLAEDEKQAPIRISRYSGTVVNAHKNMPKLILSSNLPWNNADKKQTEAMIKELWSGVYELLAYPENIEYKQIPTQELLLKELGQRYSAVAKTKFATAKFYPAFENLKQFFDEHGWYQFDLDKVHPTYLVWLTDYAYWLRTTGKTQQAILVSEEAIRRAPDKAINYLTLARAQYSLTKNFNDKDKYYYQQAALDNYRRYCYLSLKQGSPMSLQAAREASYWLKVDELNERNCSPVMELIDAVEKKKIARVQALLEQGTPINALSNDGKPALAYAVNAHNIEMVKFLLENGAQASMVITPLNGNENGREGIFMLAVYRQIYKGKPYDFSVMDMLLKYGADINAPDSNRSWVLLSAIIDSYSDITLIHYLLENGAEINKVIGSPYHSPLITALHTKNYELAKLLLDYGADVNLSAYGAIDIRTEKAMYQWRSPLTVFLESELSSFIYYKRTQVKPQVIDMLKLLLEEGADPTLGGPGPDQNSPDQNAWNINQELAEKFNSIEIKCLLEKYNPGIEPQLDHEGKDLCAGY